MEKEKGLNMILPFVFDLESANGSDYDHLPVFYFYMNMVKKSKGPIVAHQRYFFVPKTIPYIDSFEDFGKDMGYAIPTEDELNSIGQYPIPASFESSLVSDYNTQRDCWKDLLSNENKKLTRLISELFDQIENDYKERIEAVVCFYAPVSLRKVASERQIPVIFNERTTFRPPMYAAAGYFDFKENYGKGELEERYNKFFLEIKTMPVNMLNRKELLALFMTSKGLNYLNLVDKITPTKELGICLVGDCVVVLNEGLYSTDELTLEARKFFTPDSITYRDRADNRTGIEFILDCKRIASVHSNMSFDAMLLGRTSCSYGNSPFSFMANKGIKDLRENIAPIEFLNYVIFAYFVPWALLCDEEYIYWRLSKPSEIEIYRRHLDFYLKERGLDEAVFSQQGDARLNYILSKQNVRADSSAVSCKQENENCFGSYCLNDNVFDDSRGILLENFHEKEAWGRWSSAKNCTINIVGNSLAYPLSEKKLLFMAKSFNDNRAVSIFFNDRKLCDLNISPVLDEFSVIIPADFISIDKNIIEFRSDQDVKSPDEIGLDEDSRKLSLGFCYLKIVDCSLDNKFNDAKKYVDELQNKICNMESNMKSCLANVEESYNRRLDDLQESLINLKKTLVNLQQHTLYGFALKLRDKLRRR